MSFKPWPAQIIRKPMTLHKTLYPKSMADRLYLRRKEGGRGLISVEDVTKTAILGLEKYIQESEENLISASRKLDHVSGSAKEFRSRRAKECMQNWIDKAMHGQLLRQTEGVAAKETWAWLSRWGGGSRGKQKHSSKLRRNKQLGQIKLK